MGFDNTIDNRWRPGSEASLRRVREEELDAIEPPVVSSRELSFIPAQLRPEFARHDPQTQALIERYERVSALPHGDRLSPRLEEWRYMDAMKSPEEKQRYVEPMIDAVRRDPVKYECEFLFLLLVFEPVRRSVHKAFARAHSGLDPQPRDQNWANRGEAKLLHEIARQQLYDVTRAAAIEAIYRYPSEPPRALFPWARDTIAHRTLDHLRGELAEKEARCLNAAEAEAMQMALAGFEQAEAPAQRDRAGLREWRARISLRGLYEVVDAYYDERAVSDLCRTAVGRLPDGQREVIEGYFFEQREVPEIARGRGVTKSTIYNTKTQAQRQLRTDDVFFAALFNLGIVRDRARASELARRFPDGRLPDGRRIVHINLAA